MQYSKGVISSPDKASEAYSRIRAALNLYGSPPGAFLNIRLVAERLKVSATPVREALIRLANEEVVGFIRGRGYYTRALDLDDLTSDHDFATLMLKQAIQTDPASTSLPMPELSTIWQGEQVVEQAHATEIATRVESIYEHLVSRGANQRIIRYMHEFCARTGPVRQYGLMLAPAVHDALWSLNDLVTALRRGDRRSATQVVDRHTRLIVGVLPDLVKDLNHRAKSSRSLLEDLL